LLPDRVRIEAELMDLMANRDINSMFLYHYFEKERGPFLSLSDLTDEEAKKIQDALEEDNNIYCRRKKTGNRPVKHHII
jgi:hypothetical protein